MRSNAIISLTLLALAACGETTLEGAGAGLSEDSRPPSEATDVPDTGSDAADTDAPEGSSRVDHDGDGYSEEEGDCDDREDDVFPGAPELCNDRDDDCDGVVDEELTSTWYQDADGDGYGVEGVTVQACAQPAGYAARAGDCDDAAASRNPDGVETCNDLDDDCDGGVDEGLYDTWYEDEDGDGYGATWSAVQACTRPPGHVITDGDCHDGNGLAYPGSPYWGTTDRGDGSYDYDCDGLEETKHNATATWSCAATGDGVDVHDGWYQGGRPACGHSRQWAQGCDYTVVPAGAVSVVHVEGPDDTTLYMQACR